MFGRLLETIRSERGLSVGIRTHLVDGLFHPFASFITGVIIGVATAILMWFFTTDPIVRDASYLLAGIAVARLLVGLAYIRSNNKVNAQNVNLWETAFSLGATAFSLCLGALTFLAILRVQNTEIHLVLSITCAGYGSIIAARNAGRPWLALAQLYLATVPMWLALAMQGQYSGLVTSFGWAGVFLYTIGVSDITLAMRKMIIDALENKQRHADLAKSFQQQAERFDAALTNMSHGLCMFDEKQRLTVWNAKASEIIGAEASRFSTGVQIADILSVFGAEEQSKMLQQIGGERDSIEARHTSELRDGRFVSTTIRTIENGHTVIVFADITEREIAQARIRSLAWVDQLTGLMNRVSVHEYFEELLENITDAEEIAVHYVDLDRFKNVNDTLGHPIGDQLLKQVAKRIEDVCMDEARVARMTGDEFLIIQKLSHYSRTPQDLAQKIVDTLHQPFNVNSHFIRVGASVGLVIAPKDGEDANLLLKRADMALYAAKKSGRNKFAYFVPQMDHRMQQVRTVELDIKQALEKNQFTLAFQPIIETTENRISSFECLVRWTHPQKGRMMPGDFIPVAEETGQIIDIGRWVTREAIRTASCWPFRQQISVNFSAIQFQDSQFPQYLNSLLRKFKLPPEYLELEITETAFISDIENSMRQLQSFKKLGIKISLDDFGTGYTSLSQLQRTAFDRIKIDGSFIRNIVTDTGSAAVATAIAEIGKALDISVVAECVETQDQYDFVKSVGVTHVQGYFTGKPTDAKGAKALILANPPHGQHAIVSEAG